MEIKFRGFSIENNCWIHGFYHEVEVEGIKNAYIFWQGESWNVDIKSVGMFSGAYDSNGVGIHSGDIYTVELGHMNYNVVYQNGTFLGGNKREGYEPLFWDWIEGGFEESTDCSWLEIIGNTYENSNLIN